MPPAARPRISLRQRLLALAGLVVIVGVTVAILFAAGLVGNKAGGEGIEAVRLLDPPEAGGGAAVDVGPEVGKLAPDFEISDFDGKRHRLSDFRGRPVYVNFWGTFCVPCLIELPDIYALHQRYGDELVVIAVNRREPLSTARNYFEELPRTDGGTGVSFTVNGMDPDDTLFRSFRALSMPASFFVSPSGVITRVRNGLMRLTDMEAAVAEALTSSVPQS